MSMEDGTLDPHPDPMPGEVVRKDAFVKTWLPRITALKQSLSDLLDGRVRARDDYGLEYDGDLDFGVIRRKAAEVAGFPMPYIYQCGRAATRRSKRSATPAGVGIETVDARGRKVVPLWTVEGGNIPLTDLRLLAWTFDQYSRQVGTGRRDALCGPVIATAAAAEAIRTAYKGPCLRTMLSDDGTKDANKVEIRPLASMRVYGHLVRSCNLIDLRFSTWEEDMVFSGTTLTLSGGRKHQPEAAIQASIGRRIGEVIGSSLLEDDTRTITSVRRKPNGVIEFGVSQPREGIVLDI
tara:strand:- start:7127 stop:8008 length:882 start_codon:yes stop_codon:yes gene_type:complete